MENDVLLEMQIASDLNNHKFVAPSIKGYVSTAIDNIKKTETKAEMLWSEKKITKITRDKLISDMESLRYCITQINNEHDVLTSMLEATQQEKKDD
jgi:hypothetical protein